MTRDNEIPSTINVVVIKGSTLSDLSCDSINHTFQARNQFPPIKAKKRKRRNHKGIQFFNMNRILERCRKLTGFYDVAQSDIFQSDFADKTPPEKKRLRKNPASVIDEGPLAHCSITSVEDCSPTRKIGPRKNTLTGERPAGSSAKTINAQHSPHVDMKNPSSRSPGTINGHPRIAPPGSSWTCDNCHKAKFRTYDEALRHERHCRRFFMLDRAVLYDKATHAQYDTYSARKKPTVSIQDDTQNWLNRSRGSTQGQPRTAPRRHPVTDRAGPSAKATQQQNATFPDRRRLTESDCWAAAVSLSTRSNFCRSADAINNIPKTATPGYAWTCDICQRAKFRLLDDAISHEQHCRTTALDNGGMNPFITSPNSRSHCEQNLYTKCTTSTPILALSAGQRYEAHANQFVISPPTRSSCNVSSNIKSNSSPPQILYPLQPRPSLGNRHISKQLLSKRDKEQLQAAWKLISELSPQSYMIAKQADQSVSTSDFMLLKPPNTNKSGETTYHDIRNAWVNEPVLYYYIVCCLSLLPTDKRYAVLKSSQVRDLLHGGTSLWHTVFNTEAFALDVIFIPVYNEKHWSLITILPQDRLVKYFDSCGRTHNRHLQAVKFCAAQMHAKLLHHRNECKPWSAIPCPWRNMKQRNGEISTLHEASRPTKLDAHLQPFFFHLFILDSIRLCHFCVQVC